MERPRRIDPRRRTRKGVWYWRSRVAALTWAEQNGWPTDRILAYGLGWAVQAGPAGNYAGPGAVPRPWRGVRDALGE